MRNLLSFTILAAIALSASADICPVSVPVVTIPPHTVAGYSWGTVIRPMGDPCLTHIAVEPANANGWYIGSASGLYVTHNGGGSWTKPLLGQVGALLIARDGATEIVYAGIGNRLYLSRDKGFSWTNIKTFSWPVTALMVMNSTLYVGLGWGSHASLSGVYVSNLGGGLMTFKPFGAGQTGLIVWTLAGHAATGVIYAGTEIFDHPSPYDPPFFRSANNGNSWANVGAALPWHAIDSAVRPGDGYVYALMEGLGTYGSANQGTTWIPPQWNPGVGTSLLMHPAVNTRLYAGKHTSGGTLNGGVFLSNDAGANYTQIGLNNAQISDIAINSAQTRLYVTAYASGLYIGSIP